MQSHEDRDLWSSSSCGDSCPGWREVKWPGSAGWVKAEPPLVETQAAQQTVPRNIPRTEPCQSNRRTPNIQHIYTVHPLLVHLTFPEEMTHLSTESKVFFSGGGRALILLGVGPSLSVCGGGKAGSVADGGGRGEEGRVSFHPPCRKSLIQEL